MRNLISITDLSTDELTGIFDRADELHGLWHRNEMPQSLHGQKVGLWFFGNGFRNRVAFEIGARAMGADVAYLPGELGVEEPIQDIGHYLANWFTMLVVRARRHEHLVALARDAGIPTINARTGYNHPCEVIGDLQYLRRRRGSLDGLSVVFVGEVTNLCMSWFEAAVRLPIDVVQVAPDGYLLPGETLKELSTGAVGRIATSTSLFDSVSKRTELIYTDCWPKSGDRDATRELFLPYQVTAAVLGRASGTCIFLPCPPVTRGQEVSDDAMASGKCEDYAAKEFLLHAQNSVMELVACPIAS